MIQKKSKCSACKALVKELVPWGNKKECYGCYVANPLHETPFILPLAHQLPDDIPHHKATGSVLVSDLGRFYFDGNAAMTQGYLDITTQMGMTPQEYANLMGPFYRMLDPSSPGTK